MLLLLLLLHHLTVPMAGNIAACDTSTSYLDDCLDAWAVHMQHPSDQAGPPFFLYEQVMVPDTRGIEMLKYIPLHLSEAYCVVMDAGWDFAKARRLRIYCTNMNGHMRYSSSMKHPCRSLWLLMHSACVRP